MSRLPNAPLQEFKTLLPDWDSYGADAPSEIALNNAREFILEADRNNLEIYFVAPGRGGEVMIEFKVENQKAAEVYFNPDNSSELLLYINEKCIYEGDLDIFKLNSFLL